MFGEVVEYRGIIISSPMLEGNDTPKTLVAMGHLKKQESIRPGGIV